MILTGFLMLCGGVLAQTSRVVFVYVAPSATLGTNYISTISTNSSWWGLTPSNAPYHGVTLLQPQDVNTFTSRASAGLQFIYNTFQPGQAARTRMNEVLGISTGAVDPVYLILVDDATGVSTNSHGIFALQADGANSYVWPSGGASTAGPPYSAYIRLGRHYGDQIRTTWPGRNLAFEGTVIHESLHTQMLGEFSRWYRPENRENLWRIVYGQDATHYSDEILADQESPVNEGLGNYFADLHNPTSMTQTLSVINRGGLTHYIDAQSAPAGWTDLYSAPRTQGNVGTRVVWQYRWRDVPGFYLMFCESSTTSYGLMFRSVANGNTAQAHQMIINTATALSETRRKRFLTYMANRLALQMEDYAATAQGQQAHAAGTLSSSLLPFALLDIVTHFGMSEADFKADYARQHPDRDPWAFANYWANRNAIHDQVRAQIEAEHPDLMAAAQTVDQFLRSDNRYFF